LDWESGRFFKCFRFRIEERENFDLLKRAYVEARYDDNYSITKEQLEYLTDKVEGLNKVVKDVCLEKIGV
jgi:hypothetical protein